MTLSELLIQFALSFGAACIGWFTRGLIDRERRRKDQMAWRSARHFLPNNTSKN